MNFIQHCFIIVNRGARVNRHFAQNQSMHQPGIIHKKIAAGAIFWQEKPGALFVQNIQVIGFIRERQDPVLIDRLKIDALALFQPVGFIPDVDLNLTF